MAAWFETSWLSIMLVALSVVGVYVVLVALTRLSGLRSFSKMSGFDFAITVAIGSVVASTILSDSPPLAIGTAALVFLFVAQMTVAWLRVTNPVISSLTDNAPRLIMAHGKTFDDQMQKAKITHADLLAKLREANVLDFGQIEAVVAESTGDISVLHRTLGEARLDPALLDGVIGADRYDTR
ncbi:MAG: YetF domain-containing protein [Pseudomonadota bacterium]